MKSRIAVLTIAILMLSMASQLVLASATSMPSPAWRIKTAMPIARGQTDVVTGDNGLIYVIGGFAAAMGPSLTTVEAYDPLTDTWTPKAPLPQPTRGAAVAKGPDGIIYIIGGFSGAALPTVQAYNTTSDTWSTKTAIPSAVWMAGAATGSDGKIYVIGGEAAGGVDINATQIYDPTADSWTTGADMPTSRSLLGVVKAADGLIYVMGGWNGSALSIVEVFNPTSNTWASKAPMPTPKLEFGIALGPDEKIYVAGGGTNYGNNVGPFFNTVEIYDPKTNTWIIPSWSESLMPVARKELGAATGKNGRIYAIGGANGAYLNTNHEASVELPENIPPTAYIDSIAPSPATHGQPISFSGHGTDTDGSITAYKWRSSLNGTIGTSASFSVSTLAVGTHTLYFSVKDDSGAWSSETVATVTVNVPITEDPTYKQIQNVNQSVNQKVDGLSNSLTQQNNELKSKVDALSEQNTDLTNNVNDLTQKLDSTTMILLGANILIIVLVIVAIAIVFFVRRQPKPTA